MGLVILFVGVNILIDPYAEFGLVQGPHNKRRYFQDHETAAYQMARRLEQSDYSLIFGTSHSAILSEKLLEEKLLNLSVSVYGNPTDVLSFLKGLSPKAWKHIRNVYFDLDFHTFTAVKSAYDKANFYSPLTYLFKTVSDLTLAKLERCFYTIHHNLGKPAGAYLNPNGEFVYNDETTFVPDPSATEKIIFTHNTQAFESLGELHRLLAEHQIPVIYFNTVFSRQFLNRVDWDSVKKQYEGILNQIPLFVSFLYVPKFSNFPKYFRDETHHKYELAEWEIATLRHPKARAAFELTRDKVTSYVNDLRGELAK